MKSNNLIVPINPLYRRFFNALVCFLTLSTLVAQTEDAEKTEKASEPETPGISLSENGEQLNLPGIKVRIKERYVDVDATVCLTEGLLELIACAKNTKEHESVIAIDAKAAHIHAALLLLGAKPGNPAMHMFIEGEEEGSGRWVEYQPRGSNIDVYLVVKDEDGKSVERPISDFIMKDTDRYEMPPPSEEEKEEKESFPTHTFLFAGSQLYKEENKTPKYLADIDGNVISISTFGDELLCLPGINTKGNDGLIWGVDPTHIPELGSKVILRLRPQFSDAPPAEEKEK